MVVVPHSHWDREWYAPFEAYRSRLVAMLDAALHLLESDSRFEHLHLDGQTAIVDDYLEVRRDQADRMRKLIAAGRIAVGPWYVLMDEFCVSAETIIRNLQLGLDRARSLDAGDHVGYLPDMFGHVAQMPQILVQAGIADAVVWRGVPAAVDRRSFRWEAPDGSSVRAEYLPVGYAAGAFLPKEAPALLRRIAAHEEEIADFLGPDGPMLLMNGGDHQELQSWLPDLLDAANSVQGRFVFRQSSLAGYMAADCADPEVVWRGELRSGARAPVLMGVLSNRVDVKMAAALTEAALERTAEPLASLWLPPGLWPADLLDRAWLEVIRNSAHDSICACSIDEVGRAVLHRYDSARTLAGEVSAQALAIAGVATASAGWLAVNPLARARGGIIELETPGDVAPAGAQQISVTAGGVEERSGVGADLARILGELAGDGWLGRAGRGTEARLDGDEAGGLTVTIVADAARPVDPAMAPVMAEAWARAGAGRHRPLTVRVERSATQRIAVAVDDVPGWGWALVDPAPPPASPPVTVEPAAGGAVTIDNQLARVVVDPADGTFSLDGVAGHNRIVEEGDDGDTYNFSPAGRPPGGAPRSVAIEVLEPGPVRAVVRVRRVYDWDPATTVVSDIQLGTGERVVRITTSMDHRGRDHRIRAWFPLGERAEATMAECAFAAVERTGAEGGPLEPALPTFPSRRFVTAGPLTVTHQGLLEYELVDGGSALALTLLRATGVLSRPAPASRPNVAGPAVPLRDTQLPGPITMRYAVARHCPDPWALADDVWTPLAVVPAGGHGHLPDRGARLSLSGAQVSALYRREGAIEVRVFNPGAEAAVVNIPGHSGSLVDLAGAEVGRWEGSFPLAPWRFATARLDRISLD